MRGSADEQVFTRCSGIAHIDKLRPAARLQWLEGCCAFFESASETGVGGRGELGRCFDKQRALVRIVVFELDPNRQSLYHLDEVARGVLRRSSASGARTAQKQSS